jgi:hypothetical protein
MGFGKLSILWLIRKVVPAGGKSSRRPTPKNKMRGKLSPPSKRRVLGLNSKPSLAPSRIVPRRFVFNRAR